MTDTGTDATDQADSAPATVTICGYTLAVPGPFTEEALDHWAALRDQHDLEGVQRRRMTLSEQTRTLDSGKLRAQRKAVEALEARLDALYAEPYERWDRAKIVKLQDAIDEEQNRLIGMELETADANADRALQLAEQIGELAGIEEEAILGMAHHVAQQQGCSATLGAWLRAATRDDYNAAATVVQAGLTPFLNRAQRRAQRRG